MRSLFVPLMMLASACSDASPPLAPKCVDASYPLRPAWHRDSLPPDTYLMTSGHGGYDCPGTQCGLDFIGVRFDRASKRWTRLASGAGPFESGGPNATPKRETAGYEMPFYAPVDGEVIACWRSIPEEEDNNDEPEACKGLPGGHCVGGGNHLWIRTWDDKVVFLGHLRRDSIPEALCPIPNDTPLPGISGSGRTCSTGAPWTRLRDDIKLDNFVAEYPIVEVGDFIGRMGSSGNSGDPHLHIGVYDYWEHPSSGEVCYTDRPYEFTEARSQIRRDGADVDPGRWRRLECDALVIGGDVHVILPDA